LEFKLIHDNFKIKILASEHKIFYKNQIMYSLSLNNMFMLIINIKFKVIGNLFYVLSVYNIKYIEW